MDYCNLPQNKYAQKYVQLIEARKHQDKAKGKTEAHHVFPISIFGDNNIKVNLTHREHYVAHWLLWKMYLSKYSPLQVWVKRMKLALDYFRTSENNTSRIYQKLRESYYLDNANKS